MADKKLIAIDVVGIIVLCLAVLLNTLGIFLLLKTSSRTYQRVILINLSSAEILLSIREMLHWILRLTGYPENSRILQIGRIIDAGIYGTYCLTLTSLTTDRLRWPLKYQLHRSKKRMKVVLCIFWMMGSLSCLPLIFLP